MEKTSPYLQELRNGFYKQELGEAIFRDETITRIGDLVREIVSPDFGMQNLVVLSGEELERETIPMKVLCAASLVEPLMYPLDQKSKEGISIQVEANGIYIGEQFSPYLPKITKTIYNFIDNLLPHSSEEIFARSSEYFLYQIGAYNLSMVEKQIRIHSKKLETNEQRIKKIEFSLSQNPNETNASSLRYDKENILQIIQEQEEKITLLSRNKNNMDIITPVNEQVEQELINGKEGIVPIWEDIQNRNPNTSSIVDMYTGVPTVALTGVNIELFLSSIFPENTDWFDITEVLFIDTGVVYIINGIVRFQKSNRTYASFFQIPTHTKSKRKSLLDGEKSHVYKSFEEQIVNLVHSQLEEFGNISILEKEEELNVGIKKRMQYVNEHKTDIGIQIRKLFPLMDVSIRKHPLMPNRNNVNSWKQLLPILERLQNPISTLQESLKILPMQEGGMILPTTIDATTFAQARIQKVGGDSRYFEDTYLTGNDGWDQLIFAHDIENLFASDNGSAIAITSYQILLSLFRSILVHAKKDIGVETTKDEVQKIKFSSNVYGAFEKQCKKIITERADELKASGRKSKYLKKMAMSRTFAYHGMSIITGNDSTVPEEFKNFFLTSFIVKK